MGVAEGQEVSPQPPLLQTKPPQFPQPLPIRPVLQTLHQLRCPSLDTLESFNGLFGLGSAHRYGLSRSLCRTSPPLSQSTLPTNLVSQQQPKPGALAPPPFTPQVTAARSNATTRPGNASASTSQNANVSFLTNRPTRGTWSTWRSFRMMRSMLNSGSSWRNSAATSGKSLHLRPFLVATSSQGTEALGAVSGEGSNAESNDAVLGKLAETYVETIRSGAVPCLESTVVTLAETANAAAVKEAVTLYRDLMEQRVKLPTETLQELLELHKQCEQEALELFMARAFKEGICSSQTELIRQVEAVKEKFCTDNDQASRDKCEAALRDLSQVTERRISDGTYNVSGGYQLFREDQQALVEKYQELPGKGVKADAVLQEFLQSRRSLAESILSTDLSLTEKDKELKSEQEHHERAEHKREVQKKKEAEDKQKSQDRLHTCQAHTVRLRQKLEDQHAKQLTEHRRMIVHKSKEVDMLLRDGLHDKAVHLREVTYRLEEESSHITDEIMVWMRILIPILLGLAFVVLRL
ncbi:guanylate-binding protein 7-like isoform X5 [Strix uralensis]|uniref:guanylate-binding protein 7-like isoform X5 n=1 Tax=Strix uralensis TaxID=36305 RepID=UPI003DA72C39